jgi:hypothetical protein
VLRVGENPTSAVIDPVAGFAYFGANHDFVKIRLSDLTRVGTVTATNGTVWSPFIDTSAGFAYFGNIDPYGGLVSKIDKIRLSDFTKIETFNVSIGHSPILFDPKTGYVTMQKTIAHWSLIRQSGSSIICVQTVRS